MKLSPDQITIAVTVYNRRHYLVQAIESALNQTVPVRVMVVEDCGPDSDLQAFVEARFGNRITYHRNPVRRGLFDNWNACLELSSTEWISILHDDDYLDPCFVEEILKLSETLPSRKFYFGGYRVVDASGDALEIHGTAGEGISRSISPEDFTWCNPLKFPGQLFHVQSALQLGGFRKTSQYCGDWEMWFKLVLNGGGAATNKLVANGREHQSIDRSTTTVDLTGKRFALMHSQVKRNLSQLRFKTDGDVVFKRAMGVTQLPLGTNYLLGNACYFSQRMLRYNTALLLASPQKSRARFLLKSGARIFGPVFLRYASKSWHLQDRFRRLNDHWRQKLKDIPSFAAEFIRKIPIYVPRVHLSLGIGKRAQARQDSAFRDLL